MKILLLALANVAAQPAIYSSGTSLAYPAQPVVTVGQPAVAAVPAIPYYGQAAVIPAAAPVYTQTQTTQTTVAAPAVPLRRAPVAAPVAASGPSAFDAYDAQRAYRDDYQLVRGNQVVWNVPWSTLFPDSAAADGHLDFLTGFAALQKGQWAANNEDRIDDQIRQFRRRNPQPTVENRNKLDDLHLTKDLFHNVKLRRASTLLGATLPGGSGLNNWFERQSHVNEEQLAKNALQDARQAFAKEPSRANEIALRNARDNVDQADYWKDANTYDLLGTRFGGASRLGPIYRTKASGQALETARRQRRVAEEAYAKDPSEENRIKLQMAIVKIRAWEEDDDANRNEILTGSLLGAADSKLKLFGLFGNAINFQSESKWWRRLDRLNRDLIQVQRAKALRGDAQDGPVADRMLALSTYGPNAAKSTHPSNSRDF